MKSNELKVTDLMVGNWVICYHPSRLKSFEKVSVGLLHTMQEQEYGHIKEDSPLFRIVEPIPLTPEILEKNGFNDTSFEANHKYKYVILTNEYQLGYYPKTNSFNVYKKGIDPFYGKDQFCCGFQNIVKYVHELQHALEACGIDKEIVL